MSQARLIIDASERNADLYYATRFLAPDAFIYCEIDSRRLLVMNDLEIDRARSQAAVDEVLSSAALGRQAKEAGIQRPGMVHIADRLLRDRGVTTVAVPDYFGAGHAEDLRGLGYTVEIVRGEFFPQRLIKTPEEIAAIEASVRSTEEAVAEAIDTLRSARIGADGLLHGPEGVLTSEAIKQQLHQALLKRDCLGQHTIVACGEQGVDPHNEGEGPLRANEPIIMDVFPRHMRSRYFADMTRTVVRGRASDKVRRMFEAVRDAQDLGVARIRPGVDAGAIHKEILELFESRGFRTGAQDGRMQGFFHGTGHGVGLEIHEGPRIGGVQEILERGMVVTVEPGLYYAGAGGMRLEDIVVVTAEGCRNLNRMPKELELD